jgi:hypothetical protein
VQGIIMSKEIERQSVREAVAVFDTEDNLQAAIDALLSSGFHRAQLSLLAREAEVATKLSHRYRKVEDLADDPRVPRVAYVSREAIGDGQGALIGGLVYIGAGIVMGPIAAAGGTLASLATAAALGGGSGALLGTWLARLLGQQHAQRIVEQLRRGGLLLWVRTLEQEEEQVAISLLQRHGGRDVHLHDCDGTACIPVMA